MRVFFFNKKSMAWIIILIVAIVIGIILLTGNRAEPTGMIHDYIIGIL